MSDNHLQVLEQKEIEFNGDEVVAVRLTDGRIFVPVKPLCDLIGLAWTGQFDRIKKDTILSELAQGIRVTRTPEKGGSQEMVCLPLDSLNGWLFGVSDRRVKKDDVREALLRYKRDCYRVLDEAFGSNAVTARPDDELLQSDSPSAVAYRHALAIAQIARQQYYFEKRIDNHEQRIQLIEANLGNDIRFVTKEQASHISQGVRAIGTVLSKRSGKNEYGGVYGELYRQWSISSYKEIPAVKYDDVIAWLRNWYLELVDESDVPF